MQIQIAVDIYKQSKQSIEGPSKTQAIRLAQTRRDFIAKAREIENSNPDVAFELDCEAMDMESTLMRYGFDIETGRSVRR